MKVTDFVYNNNLAYFRRYFDGNFVYEVEMKDTGDTYEFLIPIEDTKGAAFLDIEKSVNLMRWIRLGLENKTIRQVSTAEEMRKSPVQLKD